jgi:hypothetical protein
LLQRHRLGAAKQVLDQPVQERTRRFLCMVAHKDAAAA